MFRGGVSIEITQLPSVHIPIIVLGHLDHHGVSELDTMLDGQISIMEIVEFFENYEEKRYQGRVGRKPQENRDFARIQNMHYEKEKNP